MKKLLVWLLILAMTVCVLASCIRGGDELPDNDNSKETEKDFGTKPDIDTDKETDADLETEADTDTETDIDTDTDTDIDTDTEAETETETEIESETESKTETETDKETETGSETETEIPDGISFNTLDVNGTEVYGKVSNDTTEFSFANELTTSGKATYAVSLDQYGIQTVITKTIPLDAGDNTVYVIEDIDGAITVYTVTIRRRPMYTVSFDTNGGTAVESQIVEEDSLASEPTTEREGYTFVRWEFDFESPITDNVEITSVWRSNVYTVTYDTSGGSAVSDATLTYGESYMLPEPTKADCTFVGWYDGDAIVQQSGVWSIANNVTLTAKWSATVNVSADSSALACSGGGVYDCDTEVTISVVSDSPLLSEGFIGWYDANDNLLSRDEEYTFTLTGNIEIIAKYGTFPELANFVYTSTSTTCKITGVIDSSVTTIVVPDFVTEIELGAFSECTHVQSLTLPFVGATKDGTSNTHLAYIFGASSYEDGNYVSSYLTHIKITGGTSIGDYAFYKGYSYTRIELPDSIETIGEYAFYYCYNLRNVSLPDNVKSIEKYAFAYCERFTSIDLPNGLETIGNYAFYYCTKITSLEIPESVLTIGTSAFYKCIDATSLTFGENSKLTTISENAFAYCIKVTSLELPSNVATIGKKAFYGCSGLTSIEIPRGVTSIGSGVFSDCNSLENITVNENNIVYHSIGNCVIESSTNTLIIGCNTSIIPSDGSVTSIGVSAFESCTGFTSIEIPSSVTSISDWAFAYCDELISIEIPSSVTSIGSWTFYSCDKLTSIYYTGATFKWNLIDIGEFNSALESATVYYYSATAPTNTTYNYYRYDTDGSIVHW